MKIRYNASQCCPLNPLTEVTMKFSNVSLITLFVSLNAFATDPLAGLPANVAARQKVLIADGSCQADLPSGSETYGLKKDVNLYLVPCVLGAYQGSSRAYMSEDNGTTITEVLVLAYDEESKSIVASGDLGEASYDAKTQTLATSAKGRGLGDCGQSSLSKILLGQYGGYTVKTVEIRDKSKCDGKYRVWPVVFTQK